MEKLVFSEFKVGSDTEGPHVQLYSTDSPDLGKHVYVVCEICDEHTKEHTFESRQEAAALYNCRLAHLIQSITETLILT